MDAFVIPMFPAQQHHTQTAIGRLAAIRDGVVPLWIDSFDFHGRFYPPALRSENRTEGFL